VKKMDVLLVIDNSWSMQPYQNMLASDFEAFTGYFAANDIDYQIGVTTTTVSTPSVTDQCSQADIDQIPAVGTLVGGYVLNSEASDTIFSTVVNVGTCGSGNEMGLEAGLMVLQNPDAGLIRDDAHLSVIFFSDEEDQSPRPVGEYVDEMRMAKGSDVRGEFRISSIVVTNPDLCNSAQINAGATTGTRYMKAAEKGDGASQNICSDSYASILSAMWGEQ